MLDVTELSEAELSKVDVPQFETKEELVNFIEQLANRQHDYGTCVYAMSMSAVAAYNYIAHKLGVTGFQASCADLDILRQTRKLELGRILDYSELLYPQYFEKFTITPQKIIRENKDWFKVSATALLEKSPDAHPKVVAHWKRLIED